tara:strand:- start:874 stop:1005 length:132 start_codon:yes stop_codon:yes gene_type:complete
MEELVTNQHDAKIHVQRWSVTGEMLSTPDGHRVLAEHAEEFTE